MSARPQRGQLRLDRDLRRYLIAGEEVVTAVRQHWMSQLRPLAAALGALVVAVWMDVKAPETAAGAAAAQVFWLAWLVTLGWLSWRVLNWRRDWFVATDKRFLMFYGFVTRKVAMMPLAKVTDLTFNRSILGRLLGYGDFRLESAGQQQALSHINFIPGADAHYRAICEVLFGDRATADLDDTDDGWDDDGWGDEGGSEDLDPSGDGGDPWYAAPPAHPARPTWEGEPADSWRGGIPSPVRDWEEPTDGTIYRSPDLVKAARLADTGEIPVVRARPLRRRSP